MAEDDAPFPDCSDDRSAWATHPDAWVRRFGSAMIGGRRIAFTSAAGTLPIRDNDTGELMARMFFAAYVADREATLPPRPLTFVWNGGPGSNCWQLHLLGFGPKAFPVASGFPEWGDAQGEINDNPDSWLGASDLVFMDPVGAGYSRATSGVHREVLQTTWGDAECFAEAIRVYLIRADAFEAPIFLAGESYGTFRAMAVAHALAKRRTRVAGLFLLSGFFDAGQPALSPALDAALQVQAFTASAYYHRRLPPNLLTLSLDNALACSLRWACDVYAPALAALETLDEASRDTLAAKLAHHTGIGLHHIDKRTMLIDKAFFADHLLDDDMLELGRYDLRMTAPRRVAGTPWSPYHDPSLAPMIDMMQGTLVPAIRYMRDVLGYRSDLPYQGPFGEAFHPAPLSTTPLGFASDWTNSVWDRGELALAMEGRLPPVPGDSVNRYASIAARLPDGTAALADAMTRDPRLRVYNARGLYDMSCTALEAAVALTPPAIRERVSCRRLDAGHVPYTDRSVRRLLAQDFARFVGDAATH